MNDFANRIKYHRLKLKMTQTELANGIISVSYLSKIENGVASPPPDTIELICKKLNIEVYSSDSDDKKYNELANSWFKYLFYNESAKMLHHYKKIKENIHLIADNGLVNMIEIHKLRYYILIKDYKNANVQQRFLNGLAKNFNNKELYYWLKFSDYFYFVNFSYRQSLESFLQAEKYIDNTFYLKKEEKYGLYYMIGLSASYARKLYITLLYTNKALEYYQKNYFLKQCAQCHLLIGITTTRLKNYEEAITSYKLAETIARKLNDKNILASAFQNIGYLYTLLDKPTDAIESYINSYEIRTEPIKKIIPISSLMKLYYESQNDPNASKWLDIGLRLISENELDQMHINEFKVYEQLIKGISSSSLEHLILNEILPFLDEKELYYEKYSYMNILADYYYKVRKYKSSADYYKKSLEIKKNL